jgi:glycosyltransferase involved in cell wall biosynthesis
LIAKAVAGLEWVAGCVLDGIVAATPTIAGRWPRSKTVTVQNFPFREELADEGGLPYDRRPYHAVYLGGIEAVRGIREMVEALEHLPDNLAVKLVLAGRFSPPELEAEIRQLPGWRRVEFIGWASREQIAKILASARLGLVTLHPVPNYVKAYPTKLFEYMSAGIPVVASDFPLCREIVDGTGCGLLVNPLDPKAIAQAIRYLLENPTEARAMGQRGRQAVVEKYNWETESQRLLEFYGRWR